MNPNLSAYRVAAAGRGKAEMLAALRVLVLTPATRAWLQANDPQALAQAEAAIVKAAGVLNPYRPAS